MVGIAVKPVLKLVVIAAAGALLAKKGHLNSAVLKGMSAVVINFYLPCLLFSKTVPSFTSDNLLEIVCGLVFALIVRSATPMRGWRNGVIFAGIFSNWGDIPLAFIITLTATAPFTTEDQALGIAYISIIMVWCFLTMFPLGGWMLVKRDFDFPEGPVPDVEEARHETGVQWFSLVERIALRCSASLRLSCTPTEDSRNSDDTVSTQGKQQDIKISLQPVPNREGRRPSISHSIRELDVIRPASSHASVHHPAERELEDLSLAATPSLSRHRQLTTPMPTEPFYERAGKSILKFLLSLVSPPAIACLLSLTIALVPQLKALFVTVPGVNMPDAPDGQPPLAWILDIAVFGGKSVPCCV